MAGNEQHAIGNSNGSGVPVSLTSIEPGAAKELAEAIAAMPPWVRYPYEPALLQRYLETEEADAPRFVIRAGDEIAGVAGLRLNWLRGPYLQMLAVLPDFQRQGLGGIVLNWLEREARAKQEKNLWVCASDFNADALRFYERHGFRRIGVLDGLVSEAHAEILMRKRLSGERQT